MADRDAGPVRPPGPEPDARLESWKAIAAYLGRGVTTVQRWEREEDLPVRRHAHAARGSVFAYRSEIDEWRKRREAIGLPALPPVEAMAAGSNGPAAVPRGIARPAWAGGLLAVGISAAVATVWIGRPAPGRAEGIPISVTRLSSGKVAEDHPGLSTDGRYVAYGVAADGGVRIAIRPTDGGPPRGLAVDEPRPRTRVDDYPRWAPDGRSLAFLREIRNSIWELRIVPAAGGTSRRLLEMASAGLSWMPDGRALAVIDRPSQSEPFSAYLVSAETGERIRRLTTPPAGTFGDWECALSPDGRRLALVRFQSGDRADVWGLQVDTGEQRPLTRGLLDVNGVAWTADGRDVLFSASDRAGPSLWAVAADGESAPRRVTGTDGRARRPSASRAADGRGATIAFVDDQAHSTLWYWDRRDAASAARRLLTTQLLDEQPALSPDRRLVAFTSTRSGSSELWVVPVDGGPPRQLTTRGMPVATPRWSPDGQLIAFASWTTGDNQDIFTVAADGGASPWRVTFDPSSESHPSWSRDGKALYFRSDREGLPRIWKTSSSGGAAIMVTHGEASEAIESTDASRVYFVRSRTVAGLWSVPVAGGTETFVAPRFWEGFWDVTRKGPLAWHHDGLAQTEAVTLRLLGPNGVMTLLGTLSTPFHTLRLGVSASADADVLTWATREEGTATIMVAREWPVAPAAARPAASAGR